MARTYLSVRGYISSDPKMIYDRLSRKKALFFCIGYKFTNPSDNKEYIRRVRVVIKKEEIINALFNHICKGDILRVRGYEQYIKLYKGSERFKAINGKVIKILFSNYLVKITSKANIETYNKIFNPTPQDKLENKELLKEFKGYSFIRGGGFTKIKSAKDKAKFCITMMELNKGEAIRDYREGNITKAIATLNLVRYIYFYLIPSHYKKEIQEKYNYLIVNNLKSEALCC